MLWEARLSGVTFKDAVTVAHLSLFLHPAEVKFFQQSYRANLAQSLIKPLENYKFGDYSDGFLRDFLGVSSLSVTDISSYEGADIIHDLNEPIPENLHGRFDAVIDGGSLEHIFNFPVAIKNLMQLLKIGGSLYLAAPANNLCGHGFYQFSPELMFRVFTKENGFELRRIVLFANFLCQQNLVKTTARGSGLFLFNGREGETAALLSRCLLPVGLRVAVSPHVNSAVQPNY
jgi:SAM-dependent methyltransferase